MHRDTLYSVAICNILNSIIVSELVFQVEHDMFNSHTFSAAGAVPPLWDLLLAVIWNPT